MARAGTDRRLAILEDLVKWENTNDEEVLEKARFFASSARPCVRCGCWNTAKSTPLTMGPCPNTSASYRESRWLRWTSLFEKLRTSIRVKFSDEIGEQSGSWKGGCTGCGYDLLPDETAEHCFRRMERNRKSTAAFTLIRGSESDFLGQYRCNSHAMLAIRYSF